MSNLLPTDTYDDTYRDSLEKCYSGAVYDVLRGLGLPDQILTRTLRPLDDTRPWLDESSRFPVMRITPWMATQPCWNGLQCFPGPLVGAW